MSKKFYLNRAKVRRNITVTTIAFVLLLAISAVIESFPTAIAQISAQDRDTGAYALVAPKLSGLGQPLTVILDVAPPPQGPTLFTEAQHLANTPGLTQAQYEAFYRASCWFHITVTFTRPDGTKDTFMPIDSTLANLGINVPGMTTQMGATTFYYTPNQIGNWTCSFTFPGQTIYSPGNVTIAPYNTDHVYYKPSTSNTFSFTVQKDPVLVGLLNGYPWSPLPTGYWVNPVSVDNREWYKISGDWPYPNYDYPYGSNYNPYSTAPNTAHILWSDIGQIGGIIGGDWGSFPYQEYNTGTIIVAGRVIMNDVSGGTFSCKDLRTGELLYRATGSIDLAHTWVPFYQTVGQSEGHEGNPEVRLWGGLGTTSWKRYDPLNGVLLQTITNAPDSHGAARTIFTQGSGEVYLTQTGGWNTTLPLKFAKEYLVKWDMAKVTNNDWRTGLVWNVSLRREDGLGLGDGRTSEIALHVFINANVVVAKAHSNENIMMGFDMKTGQRLYTTIFNGWLDGSSQDHPISQRGIILLNDLARATFHALDVKTGQELWQTPPLGDKNASPWIYLARVSCVVDNTIYIGSFDGHVYAIDLTNGKIKWQSEWTGYTGENVYNTIPLGYVTPAAADGKAYFASTNVYRLIPRTRFQRLYCINLDTGKFLWSISGGIQPNAIADGYLIGIEMQNGIQYCFGKGQTATTVSASPKTAAKGSSVLIEGTVMDQSPAQPNTPAVSDASMSTWMEYLHMQNATMINSPPTPKGVQVLLTATDPNGASINIGSTTTDAYGKYFYSWTPPNTGIYKIQTTFVGSESYWASTEETAVSVTAAASASVNPSPSASTPASTTPDSTASASPSASTAASESPSVAPPPASEAPSMTIYIVAAAVVIIAVVVAAAIVLKRRK